MSRLGFRIFSVGVNEVGKGRGAGWSGIGKGWGLGFGALGVRLGGGLELGDRLDGCGCSRGTGIWWRWFFGFGNWRP